MSDRIKLNEKQRDAVLREAGYRCANPPCHTTLALDVHHIVYVKDEGDNELRNLLALCPTCHALHHRGVITGESIRIWKQRLEAISAIPALSGMTPSISNPSRSGFPLAASEFSWRTCPVGLLRGHLFFKRGLCTFVTKAKAITAAKVITDVFGRSAAGEPVVLTHRGVAPCSKEEHPDDEHLGMIRMGRIDESALEAVRQRDPKILDYMPEPLQTLIRYRLRSRPGEPVGLLHDPKNTERIRGPSEFQFERGVVAFINRHTASEYPLEHTMSPLPTRVTDLGAPVFTDDARLVGLTTGLLELEDEIGWRPIIGNLLPLHARGFAYDSWDT